MTTMGAGDVSTWYEGGGARRLTRLLSEHKSQVALLVAAALLGGLVEATFLVAVTAAALSISQGEALSVSAGSLQLSGTATVISLVAMAVLRIGLAIIAASQSAAIVTAVVREVRTILAHAYLGARYTVQHGQEPGRLQELLTTFTGHAMNTTNALTQGLVAACTLMVLLIVAVTVNQIAALAVVGLGAALIGTLRPLRAAVRRQAKVNALSGMGFATAVSQTSQLALESHVFDVHEQLADRLDERTLDNEVSMRRLNFMRSTVPAVYTGLAFVALAVAVGIGSAAGTGEIESVGAVMLVMLRSLAYGQALQTHSTTIQASGPFIDRLRDEIAFYRSAARPSGTLSVGSVGSLRLEHVSFSYDGEVAALNDVSIEIPPREVIGIVGPSGSGKSTLVQLLLGLRSPTSGHVLSDGRPIEQFIRSEWARKVTFVPQEPRLIAGTITDNIRFFRDGVSDDDIVRAAKLAHLDDDVERFPLKYQRQVGEMGSELSGGQKQRLIIARALVEDPDVLILDEPTSSLDVRSEAFVRQTLDELRSRMTVIVIAHRLSTLDICDRIMVIEDGEVKAFDTPGALRESSEFYRESLRLSGLE